MTREQAEQIATKHFGAALPHYIADWVVPAIMDAAAVEREACAKLCEGIQRECGECPETASNCAEAIRARGNE